MWREVIRVLTTRRTQSIALRGFAFAGQRSGLGRGPGEGGPYPPGHFLLPVLPRGRILSSLLGCDAVGYGLNGFDYGIKDFAVTMLVTAVLPGHFLLLRRKTAEFNYESGRVAGVDGSFEGGSQHVLCHSQVTACRVLGDGVLVFLGEADFKSSLWSGFAWHGSGGFRESIMVFHFRDANVQFHFLAYQLMRHPAQIEPWDWRKSKR